MKTKHVFVAVTCIVIVVVLVAGLIGAAYVFKSAAKDIVKVGTIKICHSVCFLYVHVTNVSTCMYIPILFAFLMRRQYLDNCRIL